jgi:hypothetical protein
MTRVVAYVDGFNLYHGLKAVYGRRYHWLDLQALVRSLLRPGQELLEVQYFTARVRDNPAAESRQALYLEALMSHSIRVRLIEGHFQDKPRECRNCGARWMDAYDTAILVSGDSDLRPVIASVKRLRTGKRIIAAFPPRRHSKDLAQAVDGYTSVGHDKLRNAQLPPKIVTKGGVRLTRPAHWS